MSKSYGAKNRALGLCRCCPLPVAENRSFCSYHLQKRRQYEAQNPASNTRKQDPRRIAAITRHRAKNRARGLCRYCPQPTAQSRSVCAYHLEKRRADEARAYPLKKAHKRALGLCFYCSEPGSAGPGATLLLCPKHRGSSNCGHEIPPRLQYPFISGLRNDEGFDLLMAIHNAVPKSLPESIRAEVCQDVALLIIEGKLDVNAVASVVPGCIKAVNRQFAPFFAPLSLDQPVFPGSDTLLRELL